MSKRKPYESVVTGQAGDGSLVFWRGLNDRGEANNQAIAKDAATEFGGNLAEKVIAKTIAADDRVEGDDKQDKNIGNLGRRGFMATVGGVAAAATMTTGCARRQVELLVPYTRQPEYVIPGIPTHFATARAHRGDAIGLLVECHDGRPTKIEGNPDHPASAGGTDLLTQASILDLYDPDRATSPSQRGAGQGSEPVARANAPYDVFEKTLHARLKTYEADGGSKLRVLSHPSNSPTFAAVRDRVLARFPKAKFHTYAPVDETNCLEGAEIAFGQAVHTQYDFEHARVIVSLDSDFLQTEVGVTRNMRLFANGRRSPQSGMSRLYVVEPSYTTTGANADHRLRLPARDVETYARLLATELNKQGVALGAIAASLGNAKSDAIPAKWVTSVARDIVANRARAVLVAGSRQPARVHALVQAINVALSTGSGNAPPVAHYPLDGGVIPPTKNAFNGSEQPPINPDPPVAATPPPPAPQGMKELAQDLDANKVEMLVIFGGNPVYDAPSEIKFAAKIAKVAHVIRVSSHVDETAALAEWHIPRAHEYETWGDVRSMDGTYSVQQPLISPLHGGRSDIEVLAAFAGDIDPNGSDLVKAYFKATFNLTGAFQRDWERSLQRGLVASAFARPLPPLPVREDAVATALKTMPSSKPLGPDNLEIAFAADPKIFDGSYANNGWLLELPDPMTKIVWDNAALISPNTATALGVESGDVIKIARDGADAIQIPVWVQPGNADNSITLTLGWGRTMAGRYGGTATAANTERFNFEIHAYPFNRKSPDDAGLRGFDVYPLRTSDAMGFAESVKVSKTGDRYQIAQTQDHDRMEGRPIAIDATLAEFRESPNFPAQRLPDPRVLPLWKPVDYDDPNLHKWGMSIDLNACTGCSACVIACQAENNISIVGKEQVGRGREMQWMRIDRYFISKKETGKTDEWSDFDVTDPMVAVQPMTCVHCEQAPCENVCPVNATTHSPEGLNDMAYNRCIGTRYCANNCPYKVRRFNYLEFEGDPLYSDIPETIKMQFNPDVTVRMRGVMEKCTYCVQRIQEAKIGSKRDHRALKDGDIVSACAQACPAQAIAFGDLNDRSSLVTRSSKQPRGYHVLADLGTHPRTTHLGKIRNPNSEMA
jgi:Fe-S-cluster-containing dehydrogenase component/anaerobic selenocysteine-containing dehydrogenase